jgi:hypothetical protein
MAAIFIGRPFGQGVFMSAVRLAAEVAEFYRAHSPASDPGRYARLYRVLPDEPAQLARIVRGLIVHRREGGMFDIEIGEDRLRDDAETRYIDDILGLIVQRAAAALT